MVMAWLEGGQGEVTGACPTPTPTTTQNCPTWTPPPTDLPAPPPPRSSLNPPPPPKGAFGPLLTRGSHIQKRGDTPPPWLALLLTLGRLWVIW